MDMEEEDEEGLVQKKQEDQREYVACLKCTHDCFYSPHSAPNLTAPASASHLPPTAPSFLKVLDDPPSSFLEIPQAFVDACMSRCMGEAKLEGPSGWVWYAPYIHVTSIDLRRVVLGSPGWNDFAHDHMLQRGDLLVFTYFSVRQLFKVRIFDAVEGTEKSQHCLPSKPHYVSVSHSMVNQRDTSTMKVQAHDSKNMAFSSTQKTEHKGDLINQALFEEPTNGDNRPNCMMNIRSDESKVVKCCNCNINQNKKRINSHFPIESEDRHDGLECQIAHEKQEIIKLFESNEHEKELDHSKSLVPFNQDSEHSFDEKRTASLNRSKNSFKYSRYDEMCLYDPYAITSTAEKERVRREAKAFNSENPYVIKSLTASSIHKDKKLVLPKAFVDAYMPKRDALMTWVDAEGKKWKCLWLPLRRYNKAISFVSAGWPSFVQAHHLIEHDVCIFELINQDTLLFHVHIFKQRPLMEAFPKQ